MSVFQKDKVVVAQLGCGYWGPNLLRNFNNNKRVHVKFVVEPSERRREYVAENYPGIETVQNWREVIEDPELDAVVVATNAASHASIVRACLNANKHVFVEKPLALNNEDAEELAELAEKKKKVLLVGHTFLYNPAVRYLKSFIDQGNLGSLHYISCRRLNLGQVRSDVNVWWNLGPHDVSVLLYLMGGELPVSASAHGADYIQRGIEDVAFVNLTWANKVIANIQVSWLDPAKVRKMTVVGSKKMAIYDDTSEDKVSILDKGVDRVPIVGEKMDYDHDFKIHHRAGDVLLPRIARDEPLKVEVAHFVDCIQKGIPPLTGPGHARDVVRILEAANRAMKTGETIPIHGASQIPMTPATTLKKEVVT